MAAERPQWSTPRSSIGAFTVGDDMMRMAGLLGNIEASNVAKAQAEDKLKLERNKLKEQSDYRNKQIALQQSQENRAQAKYDADQAVKRAEMYAAGLEASTDPLKIRTKKGTTTVVPGREGLVTTAIESQSDAIGQKADELMRLNEQIEGSKDIPGSDKYSGSTMRTALGIPDQPMVQPTEGKPGYVDPTYKYNANSTKMNAYMNRYNDRADRWNPRTTGQANDMVATKDELAVGNSEYKVNLLDRRDKLQKEIDTLTEGVVTDYKKGAKDRSEIKTKDEYTFKAPTYESIYRGMEKKAKEDGKEITNELKYAMRQRADMLYKDARDQANKEREFQLQEKRANAYAKSVADAVYGKKSSKSKDKVSDFAEKLYKALPGDPEAVTKYIQAHKNKLAAGTPEALDALVAKISAEVANESAWDITNWAPTWMGGGTNERDVLFK